MQLFKYYFKLSVVGSDGGGRNEICLVEITVENQNDNKPKIQAAEVVYLDNSIKPGDVVIDLKVSLQFCLLISETIFLCLDCSNH